MDRLEDAHRKLAHATVGAMKHHQTMLDIAEDRWGQKYEALEQAFRCEVDNQAKLRALQGEKIAQQIQALEQEFSVPRLVQEVRQQQAASKDGQCFAKVEVLEEAMMSLQTLQEVTSQQVISLKMAFATQGAQTSSQADEKSRDDAASNAHLVQAMQRVVEKNEGLGVALSSLVDQTNRHQGDTAAFRLDLEEMREAQGNFLKMSHFLVEELNRLGQLQINHHNDAFDRLSDIESKVGPKTKNEHRVTRVRDAAMDDSKFSCEISEIISQMQLKGMCGTSVCEDPQLAVDATDHALEEVGAIVAGTGDAGAGDAIGTGAGRLIGARAGDVGHAIDLLRAQLAAGAEARNAASGADPSKRSVAFNLLNDANEPDESQGGSSLRQYGTSLSRN